MATKKAEGKVGKSGGSKAGKGGKPKRPKPKPLVPQEPIIIGGGGSINIDFPASFLAKVGVPPGKRGFKNGSVNLVRLVVLDAGGRERHRMNLNDDDQVVICFTGSLCM